jgi:hypothetical protein
LNPTEIRTSEQRREHNRVVLANCNALAWWGQYDKLDDGATRERWAPVQLVKGFAFSPGGYKLIIPKKVKPATLDEILDHMEERQEIAVTGFGGVNVPPSLEPGTTLGT